MRELAERPELFAEAVVLLVNDEEWRTAPFAHAKRFAGFDACLCFEAGERTKAGEEAVIVKRKAAATLRVQAHGRSSHSGSAPEKGRSALLALAAVAQLVAARSDPAGPDRLTAVPTILRSGDAFNVVPADRRAALRPARRPPRGLRPRARRDPGRARRGQARADHGARLARDGLARGHGGGARGAPPRRSAGRSSAAERGGASDASHMAAGGIELTIDGLGPRGGGAHTPHEWVSAESLRTRAEVALAVTAALLRATLARPTLGGLGSALWRSPSAPGSACRDLMSSLR